MKLKSRKYAGPEGFDQILWSLDLNPEGRDIKPPRIVTYKDLLPHLEFRERAYAEKMEQPPHARFDKKISREAWNEVRQSFNAIDPTSLPALSKFPDSAHRLGPLNSATTHQFIQYGKYQSYQQSAVFDLLARRRDQVQSAAQRLGAELRERELLANFFRNDVPLGHFQGGPRTEDPALSPTDPLPSGSALNAHWPLGDAKQLTRLRKLKVTAPGEPSFEDPIQAQTMDIDY